MSGPEVSLSFVLNMTGEEVPEVDVMIPLWNIRP